MTKNTTLREDKVVKNLSNTFPNYAFGNYLDLARLINPQQMRYKNKSRLNRQFTDKSIQSFSDLGLIIQSLDDKHKGEIFTSDGFNNLIHTLLRYSKSTKESDDYFMALYPNLLKTALMGMTKTMPLEFKPLIDEHLKPLMNLLDLTTALGKKFNMKGSSLYGSDEYDTL